MLLEQADCQLPIAAGCGEDRFGHEARASSGRLGSNQNALAADRGLLHAAASVDDLRDVGAFADRVRSGFAEKFVLTGFIEGLEVGLRIGADVVRHVLGDRYVAAIAV